MVKTNTNETAAAAEQAAQRHTAAKERGQAALAAMVAARKEDTAANASRTWWADVLASLAGAHVSGDLVTPEAVQRALSEAAEAEGRVRWSSALVAAAQREMLAAKEAAEGAEREAMAAAEAARKVSLLARVHELAAHPA